MEVKILSGPTKKSLKLKDAIILCGEDGDMFKEQNRDYRKPKYGKGIRKNKY